METTENLPAQKNVTIQSLLTQDSVKKRFEEMLGKKAAGFISSIISATKANKALAECEPNSVLSAAVIAATLDLPIQGNLGFAAIVPYNESYKEGDVWKKRSVAQFQMMYKGFIQLAMRTAQYQTINVTEVYEGELTKENRFTGEFAFDQSKKTSDTVIGYVAFFKMINGFEKTVYWPIAKIHAHAKRYSKSYTNTKGLWITDFDAMAKKTVLKHILSKYGILSVDMQLQQAIIKDQAVTTINEDGEMQEAVYVDNSELPEGIIYEELVELFELKRQALNATELNNAIRIIDCKEENSYAKLQTLLRSK